MANGWLGNLLSNNLTARLSDLGLELIKFSVEKILKVLE
jgi:hypothetical protein